MADKIVDPRADLSDRDGDLPIRTAVIAAKEKSVEEQVVVGEQQRQQGLHPPPYSQEDSEKREDSQQLQKGPPLGGPVLVRRTIPNVLYPGANLNMMHGLVGIQANGSRLWTPNPKPTVRNNNNDDKDNNGTIIIIFYNGKC